MVPERAAEHDDESFGGTHRYGDIQFYSPARNSGLAQHAAKDPYNFEFLGLSGEVAERDLKNALTSRITETLRELAQAFPS
nr:PDDEXK nuclease domain-containing protein [Arthrobacter sp.]